MQESSYSFGDFKIDTTRRLLSNADGAVVPLTPKVLDLLLFLVRNHGKTLSKDEIISAVWPDAVVEESNLTQNISILRRALGDVRGENAFIVTVPGRGYKFVADVETISAAAPELIDNDKDEPRTKTRNGLQITAVVVTGLIVATLAVIALFAYKYQPKPDPSLRPKIVAILPFKPLVAETSDEALEMGMTDTLIARLSNMSGVVLRPLSSVRRFAGPAQDPQAAGRELGADNVLEGNVQRWGAKVRVNVRLINVGNGEALWGATFDEEYKDIFVVQDAIASRVSDALRLKIRISNGSDSRQGTRNVEAYRFYLQARLFQFKSTRPELQRAIEFYKQAITIDPNYALAYAGLADAYRTLPITSDVSPGAAFPEAKAAAIRALELDESLSQAHVAIGYVASWYEWDWDTAENEMRRGVALDPNNPEAHRGLSILLTMLGRHEEAVSEMKLSRELDPLSLPTNALEAQTLHYASRDPEAIERLNKVFEIEPEFWIARIILARIYIRQGRMTEALTELDRARNASVGNTETISLSGYVLAKLGRRAEALSAIEELKKYANEGYSPSYNIAMIHNGLGNTDETLRWLEDAAIRRDVRLILLKVEPKWDGLRQEPRLAAIMRHLRFPTE